MPRGELAGWSYAYTDEGSGPVVLMLHGLQMDRSMWDDVIDALKHRYRLIAVDAPGHGESASVEGPMDFWRYAEMATGVLDQLGIDAAHWAGQSMGGFTCLRAAIAAPDRVKGIILIDTQAHAEDTDKLAQYEAFLQVALEQGINEDLAEITLLIYFSQTFASKSEGDVWRKKLLESDVPAQLTMIRAVFDRESVHDRLGEIRCPAVVIHGEEDIAIEIDRGRELAGVLKAPFVPVPGAGHASPAEEPAVVTRAIEEFLTANP